MKESFPIGTTKETVSAWVEAIKIPTIKKGQIFENEREYLIHSEWSADDITVKKPARFVRYFTVRKPTDGSLLDESSIEQHLHSTPAIQVDNDIICYSPSGLRKAVVVKIGTGDDAHQNLQIWNSETLEKTYDMKELDAHKAIYTSGVWGSTIAWSPDEKNLVYLAEKKLPKSEPFWSSYSRRNLDDPTTENETTPRGDEFNFRQTWGEQMEGCYETIIVMLNVETDSFRFLPMANKDFAYDLQWLGNNSIIGVAITDSAWRLGLIYCSNRESRIFQYDDLGFRYLSDVGRVALSPRVSPNGTYVLWLDRETFGPHECSKNIMYRKVFPVSTDPQYNEEKNRPCLVTGSNGNGEVPAIYFEFPKKCFTPDGESAYFLTTFGARTQLMQFIHGQSSGVVKLIENFPAGVQDVLWVNKDFLLVSCGSTSRKPSLELIELSSGNFKRLLLTKSEPILKPEPSVTIISRNNDELMPPSIYIEPSQSTNDNALPLIVWPHGGPHSMFLDAFDHDITHLVGLGFAIYRINYIGSIGTKKDTTENLLGKISELDVTSVQELVQDLIRERQNIDTKNVFLLGGSHGGFLAAHLSSQYPSFYRATCLRNPVIDLNTMVGTSDITDWVYVEAGIPFDKNKLLIPTASNSEFAEKLRKFSPITLASRVETPTLLMLGSEDLRVPMSQGFAYYRALKSYGKEVEVKVYNDNHALSKTPCRANVRIHVANFFNSFLRVSRR